MTRSDRVSVGIASMGMYLPERVVTDAQIANDSGIEEWVICEKFGIVEKRMAGPKDQPDHMAYLAAQDCFSKSDISPDEIDLVLCTTEEWKEYINWSAGIYLAY